MIQCLITRRKLCESRGTQQTFVAAQAYHPLFVWPTVLLNGRYDYEFWIAFLNDAIFRAFFLKQTKLNEINMPQNTKKMLNVVVCVCFVDLKPARAVLQTWSLNHSEMLRESYRVLYDSLNISEWFKLQVCKTALAGFKSTKQTQTTTFNIFFVFCGIFISFSLVCFKKSPKYHIIQKGYSKFITVTAI